MSDAARRPEGFEAVKARLEEIAEAVSSDEVPLDEALDLFEEAVSLGMQVSDLLEEGVLDNLDADSQDGVPDQAGAEAGLPPDAVAAGGPAGDTTSTNAQASPGAQGASVSDAL